MLRDRRRIPGDWRAAIGAASAVALVGAAAAAVYLHPWQSLRQLPNCDDAQIEREVQTLVLVAAPDSDVLSAAETIGFDGFATVDTVRVNRAVHMRLCAVTLQLDERKLEVQYQILKGKGATGYSLRLLDT